MSPAFCNVLATKETLVRLTPSVWLSQIHSVGLRQVANSQKPPAHASFYRVALRKL